MSKCSSSKTRIIFDTLPFKKLPTNHRYRNILKEEPIIFTNIVTVFFFKFFEIINN